MCKSSVVVWEKSHTTTLLLHIFGRNPTLQHYSYTFRFSNITPIICFPPSRLHCSRLSRDVLIASLTMLSGVAVISPCIPFLSLSMSLRFASYTLDLGYPHKKLVTRSEVRRTCKPRNVSLSSNNERAGCSSPLLNCY
jgi:hypothetical protein